MKEILCGIGSLVTPVVWSKTKIAQWNHFSTRRIKRDQDPNPQHCCSARNTHCELALCSYSPHLESIPNLPLFFVSFLAKAVKGEGRECLDQSFL